MRGRSERMLNNVKYLLLHNCSVILGAVPLFQPLFSSELEFISLISGTEYALLSGCFMFPVIAVNNHLTLLELLLQHLAEDICIKPVPKLNDASFVA